MHEESGTESLEDIYIKPLPWRASRVARFMRLLDDKILLDTKSAQLKCQTKAKIFQLDRSQKANFLHGLLFD